MPDLLTNATYTITADGFSSVFKNNDSTPHMAFLNLSGQEVMSQVYKWSLQVMINKSTVGPADILGLPITLMVTAEIDTPNGKQTRIRYYTGRVTAFSPIHECIETADKNKLTYWVYDLEIEPELAALCRHTDCRIFPARKTAVDMIKFLLTEHGLQDQANFDNVSPDTVNRKYNDSLAQYDESDYDFLRRIVEDAGLFFWFEHTAEGKQTIYFSDQAKYSKGDNEDDVLYPDYLGSTPFLTTATNPAEAINPNYVAPLVAQLGFYNWRHRYTVSAPTTTVDSFDPANPAQQLKVSQASILKQNRPLSSKKDFGVYYPNVGYTTTKDGGDWMTAKSQQTQVRTDMLMVNCTVPDARVGRVFQTNKNAQQPGFAKFSKSDQGEFVIVAMDFRIEVAIPSLATNTAIGGYPIVKTNWQATQSLLTCIPVGNNSLPPRAKYDDLPISPVTQGMHWATVVTQQGKPQTDNNASAADADDCNQVYVGMQWDQQERQKLNEYTPGIVAIGSSGPAVTSPYHVGQTVLVKFFSWKERPIIAEGPIYNQQNQPFAGGAANLNTQTVFMHQRQSAQQDATTRNRLVFDDKDNNQLVEMIAAKALAMFAGQGYQAQTGQADGSITLANAKSMIQFIADGDNSAIRMQVGEKAALTLFGDRLEITMGSTKMTMKADGNNFSMDTANNLELNGTGVNITASAALTAKAGTTAALESNTKVTINGKMGISLEGLAVQQK